MEPYTLPQSPQMTLISLLKQSGADGQTVKQLNRILQRYKKV